MDAFHGNFALASKYCSQLYVIRVEINKTFTTVVYIPLQNKSLTTYEHMLTLPHFKSNIKNIFYFLILR